MIDSNGRIPAGLLSGATSDFGSVQQCISIVSSSLSLDPTHSTTISVNEKVKDNSFDHVTTTEAATTDPALVSTSTSPGESATMKSSSESQLNQLNHAVTTRMSKFQGKYCLLSLKPSLPHRSTSYHSSSSHHHHDQSDDNDPRVEGSSSANTHTLTNSSTVAPSRFNKSSSEGNVCLPFFHLPLLYHF